MISAINLLEERYEDAPNGRHCSFDELRNLDKTIARRILPTLQAFATLSVFTPRYFDNMYFAYPLPDSARTDEYQVPNQSNYKYAECTSPPVVAEIFGKMSGATSSRGRTALSILRLG